MSVFEERYRQRTPRSRMIYEEARNHLAGGVGGRAKFIKPYPLYLRSAKGCRVIDVDGNEYIDVTMGAGPCILGHNPEPVLEAVRRQMQIATHTLWATELEVELAKRIKRHMPHLELLRFTNSGSEATRTAIRVARAFTGKEKIAKFEGNFHGELCLGLITKGILQPIRHTGFLSAAHTRAEMDQILTAAEEVLREMRA